MAAVTREDIANMALAVLVEAPIASLDEDTKAARLLSLHFELTREAELQKYAWTFAIFRTSLSASDLGDSERFRYEYSLPDDCLRVLPPTVDGESDGRALDWRAGAGNVVRTDFCGPLKVRYIGNLTDPNDWDALFTDAFCAALAIKVGHAMTGKSSMVQLAQNAYETAITNAYRTNAIEREGRRDTASWAYQRGDLRGWR